MARQGTGMSPAGRKACARAGSRNLENWRDANTERGRERAALAAAFRSELLAELGTNVSATSRALVESAVTSYTAICVTLNRFVQGRASAEQMDVVIRVQSQMNRTLRLLGVKFPIRANGDSDATPRGGIADYMRLRSEPNTEETNDA